jgi:pyruvate dehydrogenase E2 component (dihydrolipoamide acetyltransferase)
MIEIVIPRLDWSMDEGTFLGWLKEPGVFIRAGEPLFELEGEKATQEIEAIDSGILHIPPDAPRPGTIVAVGYRIGYLLAEGELPPPRDPAAAGTPVFQKKPGFSEELPPQRAPATAENPVFQENSGELPRQREPAAAGPAAAAPTEPTTPAITTAAAIPSGSAESRQRHRASPRARRVAAELRVDLLAVNGTGCKGRIRERDVRNAAAPLADPPSPATRHLPITPRRRTIAQRMLTSVHRTAPVTLTTRADATNLVALRRQFQSAGSNPVPAYADIITKLAAMALKQHPAVAACWHDDRLELPEHTHIGIAVDTEDGLLVPVVRDVDRLPLTMLAEQTRQLAERARARQLTAEELHGGVFTITNLGAFGIDAFTPIIKPPESAILGVGAIRRIPVVLADDRIAARDQITLSLTFDHRVIDGAPAARFLQTLVQGVENPAAWLLG